MEGRWDGDGMGMGMGMGMGWEGMGWDGMGWCTEAFSRFATGWDGQTEGWGKQER